LFFGIWGNFLEAFKNYWKVCNLNLEVYFETFETGFKKGLPYAPFTPTKHVKIQQQKAK